MATINGTANNDRLTGTTSNDTLNGLGGNDVLVGNRGNDTLNGGFGDDTADYSSLGQTIVLSVAGTVTKGGGFGTDQLNSIETITASTGLGDTIDASAATGSASITVDLRLAANSLSVNNVLINGAITTLNFTVNNFENVTGTANNDIITGNAADNTLIGGDGNDILNGLDGDDNLSGGDGNDTLNGGNGNDSLFGGFGNDTLNGGNGNDTLFGGIGGGNDTLTGGAGNDNFRFFNRVQGAVDTITDFTPGIDKLEFSASGFGGGLAQGTLPASRFVLGSSATSASQRFIYNNSNGNLFFDVDGTGSAGRELIANLSGSPNLTSNDIRIIA